MIRYAVRATPWLMLCVCCGAVAGLLAMVAIRPSITWPLQGAAVGVIAGMVAIAMDERSASIVDTVPRSLAWRTAARATVAVPPLLAVGIGSLLAWQDRLPPHLGLFTVQSVVAAGLALAVTGWRRATGTAEPGGPFAAAVISTALAVALIRPWAQWFPLFPAWPNDNWPLSWAIWLGIGVASLALLALVLPARGHTFRYPQRKASRDAALQSTRQI